MARIRDSQQRSSFLRPARNTADAPRKRIVISKRSIAWAFRFDRTIFRRRHTLLVEYGLNRARSIGELNYGPQASNQKTKQKTRVARRRRYHVTLSAIGSRQDHEAGITLLEASRRRARSPHHGGMASSIPTGAAATDLVIASELARPSRVHSATPRRHVELSCTRTSSWAAMRVLPARRQVAGVPHWHAQRLLVVTAKLPWHRHSVPRPKVSTLRRSASWSSRP
jgi:hypothetical protein